MSNKISLSELEAGIEVVGDPRVGAIMDRHDAAAIEAMRNAVGVLIEIARAALAWRSAGDRYSQYAAARFRLDAALDKVEL